MLREKLAFERGVEAFAHGIVVAVADRPHRHRNAGFFAALSERDRRILRTVIGMMNDALRAMTKDRHVERIDDELLAQVIRHSPADNTSTADVENDRQEQEAGMRGDIRNVCDPELVGTLRREISLDEIRRGRSVEISRSGHNPFAPRSTVATAFFNKSSDALVSNTNAYVSKLRLDSRRTVRRSRVMMNRFDSVAKGKICDSSRGGLSLEPNIESALSYVVHTAKHRDAVFRLVRFHLSEDLFGIVSAWRANQAATFERISCSSLSRLFSRRSCACSLRSSEFKRSDRRPESASSCFAQFMMVCRETSN